MRKGVSLICGAGCLDIKVAALQILAGGVMRGSKRENTARTKLRASAFDNFVEEFAASGKIAAGLKAAGLVKASDFGKG
ncbi:MAG: hypothetical protein ACREAC_20075, partial [Blastocatellia bacterium]